MNRSIPFPFRAIAITAVQIPYRPCRGESEPFDCGIKLSIIQIALFRFHNYRLIGKTIASVTRDDRFVHSNSGFAFIFVLDFRGSLL